MVTSVPGGNLQLYSLLYATIEGSLLTEEASINITRSTNSQPVNTVAKGYAGESPGAPMVEIDIDNAVPAADFEFDPGDNMATLTPAEVGVVGPGGKRLVAKGFIISDTLKHAVNSESMQGIKFRGRMPGWKG